MVFHGDFSSRCVVVRLLVVILLGAAHCHIAGATVASESDFPVYVDGYTPTLVRRKVISGSAAQILYRMKVAPGGITVNKTHAFIPSKQMVQTTYLRDMHTLSSSEAGIAQHFWFENPVALFSPRIIVGFAEKTHTFSHAGTWSTATTDRVRAELASRNSTTHDAARLMTGERNYLATSFVLQNRLGTQLTNSGIDTRHVSLVRSYAALDSGSRGIAEKLKNVTRMRTSLAGMQHWEMSSEQPRKSDNNCFHFESTPGLLLTEHGVHVPLRKNIVSYRGHTSFAPLSRFGILSGVAFFEYEPSEGILEIYFAGSSHMHFDDPSVNSIVSPTFFVGPADGIDWPVANEGRKGAMEPSITAKAIHQYMQSIPIDYSYLYQEPGKLCSPSMRSDNERQLLEFPLANLVSGPISEDDGKRAARMITDIVPCSSMYLRAGINNSNAYNVFETIVLIHVLLETPANDVMKLLYNEDWNEISAATRETALHEVNAAHPTFIHIVCVVLVAPLMGWCCVH